jgi:LysM repeat protein
MRLRILLPLLATAMLAAPAAAQADVMHVVLPGESLTSIAARDGLTVDQLAHANGISPFTKLIAGSTLAIPPRSASASPAPAATSSSRSVCDGDNDSDDTGCGGAAAAPGTSTGGSYLVRPGDTLSGIAARAGTTVAQLAALNGLNPNHYLLYGTWIRLPGAAPASSSSATPVSSSSVASSQPVGAAAVGSLKAAPYPTPQRVSGAQIASIARSEGVPPALAEAIGWQESGFNNDAVSSVGARGVMQILPGTWSWISQQLAGGLPLSPVSALDNVRAGVLMLHALLGATAGNQAEAAAGYYQGLASVQKYGMYPSTRQYVRDVMALAQRFGGG